MFERVKFVTPVSMFFYNPDMIRYTAHLYDAKHSGEVWINGPFSSGIKFTLKTTDKHGIAGALALISAMESKGYFPKY